MILRGTRNSLGVCDWAEAEGPRGSTAHWSNFKLLRSEPGSRGSQRGARGPDQARSGVGLVKRRHPLLQVRVEAIEQFSTARATVSLRFRALTPCLCSLILLLFAEGHPGPKLCSRHFGDHSEQSRQTSLPSWS